MAEATTATPVSAVRKYFSGVSVILAADGSVKLRVILFFLGYGLSALAFAISIYLFLPLIRGQEGTRSITFDYNIELLSYPFSFSLHWTLPFIFLITATLMMMLSLGKSFQLITGFRASLAGSIITIIGIQDADEKEAIRQSGLLGTLAKNARRSCISAIHLATIVAVLAMITVYSPVYLLPLAAAVVLTVVALIAALVPHRKHDPSTTGDSLGNLVVHRVKLTKVTAMTSLLMPFFVLWLVIFRQTTDVMAFGLESLVFLTLGVGIIGTSLGTLIRHSIYILRGPDEALLLLDLISAQDASELAVLMSKKSSFSQSDDYEE